MTFSPAFAARQSALEENAARKRPDSQSLEALSQRKREPRATLPIAVRPDFPTMALNDALHRGKSDPDPRKLPRIVQPRKGLEELIHTLLVEPGPIVAD